jgi:hypothetical protein
MGKDFEVIKSTMTCIHIILGNNPEREHVFDSTDDLLKSISKCLDDENDIGNSGYYGNEIIDSFPNSIEWMKSKGIVTTVKKNDSKDNGPIRIDKNKLVEHIVNSG